MAKGRKRALAQREKNGRIQRTRFVDMGNEVVQAQRAWNAQGGDMAKAWHPIGILYANQAITEDQERVAELYRKCFMLLYRKPDVGAAPLDGVEKGPPEEAPELVIARAKRVMGPLQRVLDQIASVDGRRAKDVFQNIVVYQRVPRWMKPVPPRSSDSREAALFMKCLRLVTETHENGLRSAA